MKISTLTLFISLTLFITFTEKTYAAKNSKTVLVIDDFEQSPYNIQRNWNMRWAWRMNKTPLRETKKIYSIRSENKNRYLHAFTSSNQKKSIVLLKFVNDGEWFTEVKTKWNLKKYPLLKWKWRVSKLPNGADESRGATNDSAAAVFVVFKRANIFFLPWHYQPTNVLIYSWSSTQPVGKVVKKELKKFGIMLYQGRYTIIETGEKKLGTWISEERNILADYRKYFGGNPKYNPVVFGLHSDSNNTKSISVADYDDIKISKTDAQEAIKPASK